MTFDEAMDFIREHGIVLSAARGPVPRMVDVIAGDVVHGSWWAHPKSHQIFAIFQKLADSPDILVCRLIRGNITFVHRHVWPALVRLSDRIEPGRMAQVHQEHTAKGHHAAHELPYPAWVPAEIFDEAERLSESQALAILKSRGLDWDT